VAAANPLVPSVLTPLKTVLPLVVTVVVSPDGMVRRPPGVQTPVAVSYATALGR